MSSLGESPLSNTNELGKTLLRLISLFSSNFKNIVEGNDIVGPSSSGMSLSDRHQQEYSMSMSMSANSGSGGRKDMREIYGGARIAYIFNETFVNRAIKQMNPFEGKFFCYFVC